MLVYRLASARYAPDNAEGARLYGGRWNQKGTPVIYTSSSVSLAATEIVVHYGLIPADYWVINIEIPDSVEIEAVDMMPFGNDWHKEASIPQTAAVGSAWANSLLTAVLRVPSAVIRTEYNYILNPLHPLFREIRFAVPAEEIVDPRLRSKQRLSGPSAQRLWQSERYPFRQLHIAVRTPRCSTMMTTKWKSLMA